MRNCFIIIVHYGKPEQARRAVQAVKSGTYQPAACILVDHGLQLLPKNHQDIQYVRPDRNGGYAAGINAGLEALHDSATADDIVVCMNSDIAVYPETLATVMAWWNRQSTDVIAGIVTEEAGQRVWGGGYVNWLTGRTHLLHHPQPKRLRYIHGAFFSAPYGTFMRLSGLPTEYFLYWEDVAFSRRAQRSGISLAVIPNARAAHQSHGRSPDQLYYLVRNGALYLQRCAPQPWRLYWRCANQLRLLYHRLQPTSRAATVRTALEDARNGQTGQRI